MYKIGYSVNKKTCLNLCIVCSWFRAKNILISGDYSKLQELRQSASGINRGLSSHFWWLRSENNMKLTKKFLMCTERHVLVKTMFLNGSKREWSNALPLNHNVVAIEKGAFGSTSTMVVNFTYIYIYIYIYIYVYIYYKHTHNIYIYIYITKRPNPR